MIGQLAERRVTYPTQSLLTVVTCVANIVNLGAIGTTLVSSPILFHIAPILVAPAFFPPGTIGTLLRPLICGLALRTCALRTCAARPFMLAPLAHLAHFLFLHLFWCTHTCLWCISVEFSITSTDNHWHHFNVPVY